MRLAYEDKRDLYCINILLITGKANGYYFLYIVYSLFKQMSTGCVMQTKCICVVCADNTTEKACIIQSTLVTTCMITISLVCRGMHACVFCKRTTADCTNKGRMIAMFMVALGQSIAVNLIG